MVLEPQKPLGAEWQENGGDAESVGGCLADMIWAGLVEEIELIPVDSHGKPPRGKGRGPLVASGVPCREPSLESQRRRCFSGASRRRFGVAETWLRRLLNQRFTYHKPTTPGWIEGFFRLFLHLSTDHDRGPLAGEKSEKSGADRPCRNSLFQACFVGFTAAKRPGCWRAGLR